MKLVIYFGVFAIVWGIAYFLLTVFKSNRSAEAAAKADEDHNDGRYENFGLAVVGESKYQGNLEAICGPRKWDSVDIILPAVLIAEDENKYDKNAMCVKIEGKTVGYLSRADAIRYRNIFNPVAGEHRNVRANIKGGWDRGKNDRGNYGVYLNIQL